jgi:hypothetical protein
MVEAPHDHPVLHGTDQIMFALQCVFNAHGPSTVEARPCDVIFWWLLPNVVRLYCAWLTGWYPYVPFV